MLNSEVLTILTNGGKQVYDQMAVMKEYPLQVYFKENSLANIVSLQDVASMPGVAITMDSSKERTITVKMGLHKEYKFLECPDGLYHYDTSTVCKNVSKTKSVFTPYSNSYSLAMSVAENKSYFTKSEVAREQKERRNYNRN